MGDRPRSQGAKRGADRDRLWATQRLAGWTSEDQPVVSGQGEAGQVPLDGRDDHFRDRDEALTGPGLRRPEGEPAAANGGQLPDNAHGAGLQVDIAAAERAQFAPAQTAEHGEQHQGAGPLADRVGERVHLADGEDRPLG